MRPVLVVQHEDDCPPALLGCWLVEAGLGLDVRRPYAGEALPEDLGAHAGMVVLGGRMGADDDADHAWLGPTKALLADAVEREVPTLGVCLGHQLLASALGGTVARNPRGTQLGLLEVGWRDEARDDALVGALCTSRRALQWNDDVVTGLPAGAVLLAAAPAGEPQVVRYGPAAWGVQNHPEVDADVVRVWAAADGDPPGSAEVVAALAAAREELDVAWRPLASSYARLAGA